MTARNAVLVGAVCAAFAAALTGCAGDPDAGTNGLGKLSPAKIESKARRAATSAHAVRLSGNVVSKGRNYKLDMRLSEKGGTGHLSTKSATFALLRVGDHLYLKADTEFWAHQRGEPSSADAAAARKLEDKYVKVPSGDPAYRQLSGFTDMDVLLEGLLGLHGKPSAGDRGEVNGVRTIRITGSDKGGASLDVSLEGTPYPLRLQRAGGAGVLQLADWNKDFTLKAPAKDDVVDYGRRITAGG